MVLYKVLYGRTLPPRSTSLHIVCQSGEKDTPFVVNLNNTTGEHQAFPGVNPKGKTNKNNYYIS